MKERNRTVALIEFEVLVDGNRKKVSFPANFGRDGLEQDHESDWRVGIPCLSK